MNRIVIAIPIDISVRSSANRFTNCIISICIDESMQFCGVIAALNPVQLRFLIVDIATIAERVAFAQRIGQRASGTQQLAPRVVLVFYYKRAGAVKNANDIALQIVDVGIDVPPLYLAQVKVALEVMGTAPS